MQDLTPNVEIIPMRDKVISELEGITEKVGGLGGRLASTIVDAINSDGNLIKDVINSRLDTSAQNILAAFTFGASGALQIGSYVNGVSGDLRISPNGIVARDSTGANTITVDGTTGAVTLTGTITASAGNIGGFTIGATSLSVTSGGNTTTISSGATAFSAGPTASPTVTITQAGALTATGASISGAVTITSGSGIANLSDAGDLAVLNVIGNAYITDLNVDKLSAGTISSKSIVMAVAAGTGDVEIRSGIATGDFANTGAASGFIIGVDDSDSDKAKFYFGNATDYVKFDGTTVTATGAIVTGTGSSITTSYLSGLVGLSNLNVANRGWVQTSAFSVTDSDTVAWGAGTFTAADGTAYAIDAGNTGNMVAKTYVYLDTAVSTTAYQITTTATTAVGAGRVLIATAQNNTTEATFTVLGGQGGQNIDASSIVSLSITANEIAASTITAGKLTVSQLSAITADLGSITAGSITVVSGGNTVALTPGSATAIAAGPTGSPTFTVTQAGVATMSGAVITGSSIGAYETFTSDGTWTKPAGAQFIYVVVVGAGGGGGSGAKANSGTAKAGGGGGGGGATTIAIIPASTVGATVAVTVGTGGAGGAGIDNAAAGNVAGNNGSNGEASSFGNLVVAGGGGYGSGGSVGTTGLGGAGGGSLSSADGATQGNPAAPTIGGVNNGIGGWSPKAGNYGEWGGGGGGSVNAAAGASSIFSAGGGGFGGYIDAGDSYTNPVAGGDVGSIATGGGGAAGVSQDASTAGTNGAANTTNLKGYGGQGGGGGGSSKTQAGSAGGDGGIPGGGGGGGGSMQSGTGGTGGKGGDGGRGEVRIFVV